MRIIYREKRKQRKLQQQAILTQTRTRGASLLLNANTQRKRISHTQRLYTKVCWESKLCVPNTWTPPKHFMSTSPPPHPPPISDPSYTCCSYTPPRHFFTLFYRLLRCSDSTNCYIYDRFRNEPRSQPQFATSSAQILICCSSTSSSILLYSRLLLHAAAWSVDSLSFPWSSTQFFTRSIFALFSGKSLRCFFVFSGVGLLRKPREAAKLRERDVIFA